MNEIMKKILIIAVIFISVLGSSFWFKQNNFNNIVSKDKRNKGVDIYIYNQFLLNPNVLIIDIQGIPSTNSQMDVIRVLMQYAQGIKGNSYSKVILSYKGTQKFFMNGDYFKNLGKEYGIQNPMYTVRTMPENLYKPEGKKAFSTWTGGALGVLSKQMQDLKSMSEQWYLDDLVSN
ncbi:hypothetical protein KO527_02310 [Pseudoalteromonas sp. C2R02]|uniref:hypothetical protein n=1 Tax=Pseudoalteromonas sp. C2R02 TaxID=2841565 RepID=UPI001C097833|nr:hypothetical protein [Pseudoalteromonas sp. C2R02]MBU2968189.1 hypothetical protein [Pseudoalteromonas sp. C2R02]